MTLAPASQFGGGAGASQVDKWAEVLAPPTLQPLLTRWKSDGGAPQLGRAVSLFGSDASTEDTDGFARMCAAVGYYVAEGVVAAPSVVCAVLERRRVRAAQRRFGLQAQRALLGCLSFSSAKVDSMLNLHSALRGRVAFYESSASTNAPDAGRPDVSCVRSHYGKAIEGAGNFLCDRVQGAFLSLYTYTAELLAECTAEVDPGLMFVLLRAWAVDFEARDHEFLLRVGLLSAIRRLLSLRSPGVPPSEHPAEWVPWPADYVRGALSSGTLSKREVIVHMLEAPRTVADTTWLASHGLDAPVKDLCLRLSVDTLATYYDDLVFAVLGTRESGSAAAVRIQAAIRGSMARRSFERQKSGIDAGATIPEVAAGFLAEVRAESSDYMRQFRCSALAVFRAVVAFVLGVSRKTELPVDDETSTRGVPAPAAAVAPEGVQLFGAPPPETGEVLDPLRHAMYTKPLRDDIFSMLEHELVLGAAFLYHNAHDSSPVPPNDTDATAAYVEDVVFSHVRFLVLLRPLSRCQRFLVTSKVLSVMSCLVLYGSPRIQRAAMLLWRDSLLSAVVHNVDAAVFEASDKRFGTLAELLVSLGASALGVGLRMSVLGTAETDLLRNVLSRPQGPGAGAAYTAVGAAAVDLLRVLMCSSTWAPTVSAFVQNRIEAVLPALPHIQEGSLAACRVIADSTVCLSLFGGTDMVLYAGTKIALANSDRASRAAADVSAAAGASNVAGAASALARLLGEQTSDGTVIAVHGDTVQIVFDDDKEVQAHAMSCDLVVPVCGVQVPPSMLPLTPSIAAVFSAVLMLSVELSASSKVDTPKKTSPSGPNALSQLLKVLLKRRALQALLTLLRHPASAEAAVRAGLVATLSAAALSPVVLPQFVSYYWLQRRSQVLRGLLIEGGAVLLGHMYQDASSGASTPSSRLRSAEMLAASFSQPLVVCIKVRSSACEFVCRVVL